MFDCYPYLFADLLSMVPVGLAFLFFPRYRRDMFIAVLICLPAGGMGLFHMDYWAPKRLFGLSIGLEDGTHQLPILVNVHGICQQMVSNNV